MSSVTPHATPAAKKRVIIMLPFISYHRFLLRAPYATITHENSTHPTTPARRNGKRVETECEHITGDAAVRSHLTPSMKSRIHMSTVTTRDTAGRHLMPATRPASTPQSIMIITVNILPDLFYP